MIAARLAARAAITEGLLSCLSVFWDEKVQEAGTGTADASQAPLSSCGLSIWCPVWWLQGSQTSFGDAQSFSIICPFGKSQEEACVASINVTTEVTASFLLLFYSRQTLRLPRFKGRECRLVGSATEKLEKFSHGCGFNVSGVTVKG